MQSVQGLLGAALIPLLVLAVSENRRKAVGTETLRFVAILMLMQAVLALLLLKLPASRVAFEWIGRGVIALQQATEEGARLVFGHLAGGPAPYELAHPENSYVLAFRMLPMIVVVAALMRLLFHWGIMQRVVGAFAFLLRKVAGVGGPLATVSSASIFLGPVEAPLLIRPYVANMGRSALLATMTVGMATVAGTVLALYASFLAPTVPDAAGHLLAASIINVPAALMLARIAVPADPTDEVSSEVVDVGGDTLSSMDAVARGTVEGFGMAAAVGAMLIVAVALVALVNAALGLLGAPFGVVLTLQSLLGAICAPLAWMIGISWSEAPAAGALLGQKFVLNEFLAYLELARTPPEVLSERSRLILTYALCSFANLGSLGIMIGGLTAMVPARRQHIVALAPRALLLGFLSTLMSAAIVSLLV